jgi:hypothetical protein
MLRIASWGWPCLYLKSLLNYSGFSWDIQLVLMSRNRGKEPSAHLVDIPQAFTSHRAHQPNSDVREFGDWRRLQFVKHVVRLSDLPRDVGQLPYTSPLSEATVTVDIVLLGAGRNAISTQLRPMAMPRSHYLLCIALHLGSGAVWLYDSKQNAGTRCRKFQVSKPRKKLSRKPVCSK